MACSLKTHQCLGRYKGDILPDVDKDESTALTSFSIAKDMSIQGIDPCNWMYWINHPPPGKKPNAEFKVIEGSSERFIVCMPTRRIRKGEEIFADYYPNFTGFEPVSAKQRQSCLRDPKPDEWNVGEYVLIYGRSEDGDEEQVWVAKIVKKYKGDRFGILWMYHPSHLSEVPDLEMPLSLKQKAQQFAPFEMIVSEHGAIIKGEVIMARVPMMARQRPLKGHEQGTWWWTWVIGYRREIDVVSNTVKVTPYITTHSNYFKKRRVLGDWDVNMRAQEMGLQVIEPIKREKMMAVEEKKPGTLKRARDSLEAETPIKKRRRKTPAESKPRMLSSSDRDLGSEAHDTQDRLSVNQPDGDEDAPSRAIIQQRKGPLPIPSTTQDHDEDNQSRNQTSSAVDARRRYLRTIGYALRSIEQSQVYEHDEVSDDVAENLLYLFEDHGSEESEAEASLSHEEVADSEAEELGGDAPTSQDDLNAYTLREEIGDSEAEELGRDTPISQIDLTDNDNSGFPTAVTPKPATNSDPIVRTTGSTRATVPVQAATPTIDRIPLPLVWDAPSSSPRQTPLQYPDCDI